MAQKSTSLYNTEISQHSSDVHILVNFPYICLTPVTRVKCGVHSTLCWKIENISDSPELFGL